MTNRLLCDFINDTKDILLQWELQNFQCHFEIGKDVYSGYHQGETDKFQD